jgi:hypothetical protein
MSRRDYKKSRILIYTITEPQSMNTWKDTMRQLEIS